MKSIKFCCKGFTLKKLRKWEFFKSKFLKTFQIIQNNFPPSETHQNGPKLSESRKIDDIQKILENPENYPDEFLNESLIKKSKFFQISRYLNLANFIDIPKLFFRSCKYSSGVLETTRINAT